STPGMTGRPGKCPLRYHSSGRTFLRATTCSPGSSSTTSSIRRKGSRCGRIASISSRPNAVLTAARSLRPVDSLAPEAVVPRLRGRFGREYLYVDSPPPTQLLLAPDAREGAVVVAGEQTAGRGRLGRRWLAPGGTSVLCPVQLRPRVD